jgi:hypothetical protein
MRASGSDRRIDLAATAVLLVLGLAVAVPHLWSKVLWSPDGLFYEAQTREVRGEGQDAALRTVFDGPLAARPKEREAAVRPDKKRIANPEWVAYSAPFYRRRWTVPVAAAALIPVAGGDRALEDASLIGLALLGPLLFWLLRSAFPVVPSTLAAGFCVLLPPVLSLAPHPGTDYAGLALLVASLIALLRIDPDGEAKRRADGGSAALDGGAADDRRPWFAMPAWVVLLLVLAFTRDEVAVALTGAAALAFVRRSRRLWLAFGLGIVAYLPPLLLFKVPLRENLAYVLNDYRVPTDTSWSHILSAYPGALGEVLHDDLRYPLETAIPALTIAMEVVFVAGVAFLFWRHRPLPDLVAVARGTLLGAVATILLSVNYTDFRLELVFVPAAAVGLAGLLTAAMRGALVSPWRPRSTAGAG